MRIQQPCARISDVCLRSLHQTEHLGQQRPLLHFQKDLDYMMIALSQKKTKEKDGEKEGRRREGAEKDKRKGRMGRKSREDAPYRRTRFCSQVSILWLCREN